MKVAEFNETMGKVVRAFRLTKGMSQRQVAEAIGLPHGQYLISMIEKGDCPVPLRRSEDYQKAVAPPELPAGTLRQILLEHRVYGEDVNPFRSLGRWASGLSSKDRLRGLLEGLEAVPLERVRAGRKRGAQGGSSSEPIPEVALLEGATEPNISYAKWLRAAWNAMLPTISGGEPFPYGFPGLGAFEAA